MNNTTKSFYDAIGVDGLKKIAREYSVSNDIPFVKKHISKGEKVLDLACGYGRVTIPLAQAKVDITGIDLDKKLINYAKEQSAKLNLKVRFDVGNMIKLPYQPNSFNKIFCLWNSFTDLLTIKEQKAALDEMWRVLKNDGSAFLVLPNGDSMAWKKDIARCNEGRIVTSILEGEIERQYVHDVTSLKKLLTDTKFSSYEISHINMHKRRRMLLQLKK